MKLPNSFRGTDGESALRRILDSDGSHNEPERPTTISPKNVKDPKQWIILDDNYQISINRFHHNNNWDQTHKLLQNNNQYMPNLLDSNELDRQLLNHEARYADGSLIPPKIQDEIFNERYKVRSPWRLEWLDAKFEQRENGLYLLTNHIVQPDNSLKPQTEELLEDTLMEDRTPGISLNNWIRNPNKYGLPKSNIKQGSLYYWHPRDGRVAGLSAGSGRALDCSGGPSGSGRALDCSGGPSGSDGGLGARAKILRRLSYDGLGVAKLAPLSIVQPTLEQMLKVINNPDLNREGMSRAVSELYKH